MSAIVSPESLAVALMLEGGMVLVSLMLLIQGRLVAMIQLFAFHALVLTLALAWQAHDQSSPHLYLTAALALVGKVIAIPWFLRVQVRKLDIACAVEPMSWVGLTILFGIGLVALSMVVVEPLAINSPLMWEVSFALAVVLLGLLIMISRENPVGQIIGYLTVDDGIMLAAGSAHGLPFLIDLSVVASGLAALVVFYVLLTHIRTYLDTVDVHTLHRSRGDC